MLEIAVKFYLHQWKGIDNIWLHGGYMTKIWLHRGYIPDLLITEGPPNGEDKTDPETDQGC